MILKTKLYGKSYQFDSVKQVLSKASELKSGDTMAGLAAESKLERIAAKVVLSDLTVNDITENPSVAYEKDAVTRLIMDDLDSEAFSKIKNWSIGELREWILDENTTSEMILKTSKGLTSENISAVSKLMGNMDLVYAGAKLKIKATCNTTIGGSNTIACRLQPNHPTDNIDGVIASTLEGLSFGSGDALLGLNPAVDTVDSTIAIWNIFQEIKEKLEIPTQTCVLSHVTTQMEALKTGATADLCFQSIAGTEKACAAFGINIEMLEEAQAAFLEHGTAKGKNVMYFETGQASELSSSAHYESDQVTMECRCYGLARHFNPFLVNTVVGFMGPEYIYDGKQLIRAGLEDVFNGHLHGLPMGCDVCYTNHMPADQNDSEVLAMLLAQAGCHYFMGVPQADDIMLMYQSTGFHDIATLRELTGKRPIPEFQKWLENYGFMQNGKLGPEAGNIDLLLEKL
ncbi:MAG: ethanolamine ammonia-lyase subunit EutB [Spirochaetales bacterium]|nr:ethanolamine ammonia-lyase subunit EutB [Spirochaetales bacterium]